MATGIDHFGFFEIEARSFDWERISGLLIVLFGVWLTVQETSQLGTVVVVFGSGIGVVVQIRDLVAEIAADVQVGLMNSTNRLAKQITASSTEQTKMVQDVFGTQISSVLARLAPRHEETGLR